MRSEITLETSGSEGVAKRVELPLEMLRASARMGQQLEDLQPGDCWLNCMPQYHVSGVAIEIRCREVGATMLRHERFDPERIHLDLRKHPVTHLSLVPVMLSRLLDQFGEEPAPGSLKTVLIGGDRLQKPLARRAVEQGWPIVVSYGMTESASRITMLRLNRESIDSWDPGDVGPPLPGVELSISIGGEVCVRSEQLFGDPLFELVTRDRGFLDSQGHLHLQGRLDQTIISGGVTVDPVRVEQLMLEAPGVEEVGVTSIPDPEWGERIVALVRGQGSQEEVKRWAGENIPSAVRPRIIRVVASLPRNRLGKLDRARLAEVLQD